MSTRQVEIEGPRCPACQHPTQIVTFEPVWAWGVEGGSSEIVARACGNGCGWTSTT